MAKHLSNYVLETFEKKNKKSQKTTNVISDVSSLMISWYVSDVSSLMISWYVSDVSSLMISWYVFARHYKQVCSIILYVTKMAMKLI